MQEEQKLYHITSARSDLYVTEIGRRTGTKPYVVKPYMRNVNILHFVLHGKVDFCDTTVETGQSFLATKQNVYSLQMYGENYEICWIAFDGEKATQVLQALGLNSDDHAVFDIRNVAYTENVLHNALETYRTEKGDDVALSALLACLPFVSAKKQEAPKERGYLESAIGLMKRNHYRSITMQEIAKHIHISEKYLYKLFVQKYGKSPKRYFIEIRMEAAKKMLMESNLTVKQIATIEGFSNQSAFSKAFADFYGCSPTELRKKERL